MSRYRLVLLAILGVAILAGATTFWSSRIGRHVRFISRIQIQNDSGHDLRNVQFRLSYNDDNNLQKLPFLAADQRHIIDVRTSDLNIFDLSFELDGKPFGANLGGLATPGETFVVRIRPGGHVEGDYAF